MKASVVLGGATLELVPGGGALDPRSGRLFVADLHLGKGAAFRAGGLPLPPGTSVETLARVDALVARTGGVEEVWVLGDLVHARSGIDRGLEVDVAGWIAGLPGGRLHLVRGNHDIGAGRLPAAWMIHEYPDPFTPSGGPRLAHHPPEFGTSRAEAVLAGHLHPAVRVGRGRRRGPKRAAFLGWGDHGEGGLGVLVLPALGRLVDGAIVRGAPGLRAWAFDDTVVEALPTGSW